MVWFCTVSAILVLVGLVYCIFGLSILPVEKNVLVSWTSAIYGSIMIGWGLTLFLVGWYSFRRRDAVLMRIALVGVAAWLVVEAISSAYLGVFFNVGVDVAVLLLFSLPLIWGMRTIKTGG